MPNDDETDLETLSDPVGRLEALTDRLVTLVDGDLSLAVPDCPGWTLRDLVAHVGRVYGAVCTVVEHRATDPVKPGPEAFVDPDLDDEGVRRWFRTRIDAVIAALRSIDPSTPLWTWSDQHTAAFYRRRMVHETAVHLADAARARGRDVELDRDVCVDGVDEFFDVMLPVAVARAGGRTPSGTLHLHCTDGNGEWMLVPDGDRILVSREHAKGDVAWRGPAAALLLAVWGRRGPAVDVIGDQVVSAEWSALAP